MNTLADLSRIYYDARADYRASIDKWVSASPEDRVALDKTHVRIRKAYFKAEDAYFAALDAEAERAASERTSVGMSA